MTQQPEEQLDIINPQGEIIQTVDKSVAHRDGLLHRIVIAELKNKRGEYCFVKQASDRQDPGSFVSPVGGHVSSGEDIEHALIRECEEEAGLTPTSYRYIGQTIFNREVIGKRENHLFMVYEIDCDRDPILNHESVEYKWFSTDDISRILRTNPSTFGAAWHHVFKNIFPEIYNK